jgi:hypothetical protein
MEFLKRHYEKIILSVVLLGLAVAAVLLSLKVRQVRSQVAADITTVTNVAPPMMAKVNTQPLEVLLNAMSNPPPVNIMSNHLLLNPVPWYQKTPDNVLIKDAAGTNVGAKGVVVTKITPLNYTIRFEGLGGSPENPRYKFTLDRPAASIRPTRPTTQEISINSRFRTNFVLKEIRGEANNPTEAVIELITPPEPAQTPAPGSTEPVPPPAPVTNEVVVILRDKPFVRPEAYRADMAYTPENQTWANKRKNEMIKVNQEDYLIFDITENSVILMAPNLKRIPLPYNPAP